MTSFRFHSGAPRPIAASVNLSHFGSPRPVAASGKGLGVKGTRLKCCGLIFSTSTLLAGLIS